MAKAKKESAKKASDIFHNIINASVTPPAKAITLPEKSEKKKQDKKK